MRYLRTNTATIVTVGPFYDKTDGVTIETGLTITNERISFVVDLNDGSAPTLVLDNVTGATSATSNDLNYIANCDAGLMQMELAAANVNYLGRAFLTITDAANHCPVFHEFMILPAMVYDSLILGTDVLQADMTQILGTAVSAPATAGILDINLKNIANAAVSTSTAQLGVNVVQISADGTAADNAEAFFDGTGYAGTNNVIPTVTTTGTATNLTNLPAAAATAAELAKVPKSDSNVSWNATALAAINAEVDTALNTAIPGSPTANSMNERMAAVDDAVAHADYGLAHLVRSTTPANTLDIDATGVIEGVNVVGTVNSIGAFNANIIYFQDEYSLEDHIIAIETGTGVMLQADAIDAFSDDVIEGTLTRRQAERIILAALAGKSSGGGTATIKFRNLADDGDRITATVDGSGNRTAITISGA